MGEGVDRAIRGDAEGAPAKRRELEQQLLGLDDGRVCESQGRAPQLPAKVDEQEPGSVGLEAGEGGAIERNASDVAPLGRSGA